jgi:hypothetical protein
MRLSTWGVVLLIALGAAMQTDSEATGYSNSSGGVAYTSEIRVEPDTLHFVWSQIEGYRVLAADGIEECVTARPLLNAIDRTGSIQAVIGPGRSVVESAKQEVDTLKPPWEGPFFVGWSAPFRIEYEATQLIPLQPASVIGLIHGVASPTPDVSKECSLFVWDGRGSRPGSRLYGASVTASAQDPLTVYLNYYSTPPITVDGPFWVGNFEMDTLYPTSSLDSTVSHLNAYAEPDSNLWYADQVEYFHGAIVSYDAIFDTLETMIVYNDGDSTLDVSNIEANQSWVVNVSPLSFSVPPGGSQSVAVEVARGALGSGTYQATLTIHNDDPADSTYEEPVRFVVNTVGVAEEFDYSVDPSLSLRIDPNPVKSGATIRYEIPEEAHVKVCLYDRVGRLVVDLVDDRVNSGVQSVYWDGRDRNGRDLPAGVYLCTFSARLLSGGAERIRTAKLVLLD